MKTSNLNKIAGIAALLLLLLTLFSVHVAANSADGGVSLPTHRRVMLIADPSEEIYRLPAPPISSPSRAESASFIIDYLENAYNSAGDWCYSWPTQAKVAFEAATLIWASIVTSPVPIEIEACWADLGDSRILGYSLEPDHHWNFSGAPKPDTAYTAALADALAGTDLNGSEPEMYLAYNKIFNFYFGTDGNPPQGSYDFETVVLHEMGHGLGFSGSARQSSGTIVWKSPPAIYDRFTQDGSGIPMLDYESGSPLLAQQMTSNNVYFNGLYANAANAGAPSRLYTPNPWEPGSSYSHLDDATYDNTPNALMTHALGSGSSIHDPGPITRGIFDDVGWKNSPPAITGIPDQVVSMNSTNINAVDLWGYTSDHESPISSLTFDIANTPASGAGVALDITNRYVNITPSTGWTGQTDVTLRVTDPGGLSDTYTFQVTVARIWTGNSSQDWFTGSNWSPTVVPGASELVLVPPVLDYPIISENGAAVGGLVIQPGATLDLTDRSIDVEEQVENYGTLRQTLPVNGILATEFLHITDQSGVANKYYGLQITSASLTGSTSVTVSIAGNQFCSPRVPGVRRCYQISPADEMVAAVRFYFSETERDDHSLSNLLAFHESGAEWVAEPGPYDYLSMGNFSYLNVQNIDEFSPFALSEYTLDHALYLPIIHSLHP